MLSEGLFLGFAAGSLWHSSTSAAQASILAAARMNELRPRNGVLVKQPGLRYVTEAISATPGVSSVLTTGLVEERRMVGSVLQETKRPAPDRSGYSVKRIDHMSFNRIEARWDYVSMDMRASIGVMSSSSFGHDPGDRILVTFEDFAMAAGGTVVAGQMLHMNEIIAAQSAKGESGVHAFAISAS